jgi:hypothetical protein
MTVPSSRPELDTEPDDELELSRITALVGELLMDVRTSDGQHHRPRPVIG